MKKFINSNKCNQDPIDIRFVRSLLKKDRDDFNDIVKDILIEKLAEKAYQLYEAELKLNSD